MAPIAPQLDLTLSRPLIVPPATGLLSPLALLVTTPVEDGVEDGAGTELDADYKRVRQGHMCTQEKPTEGLTLQRPLVGSRRESLL